MTSEQVYSQQTSWRSERRPDVSTGERDVAAAIAWADAHPHAWDVVTHTRSKAFGVGSCVYIGWAQRSMAPEAILERVRQFHALATGQEPHLGASHIMVWRAQFTFRHYRDPGFTGGFFQQHDERYPRLCLTLDYTPGILDQVVGRFLAWCGTAYATDRVTVDGEAVRTPGGSRHG